jgi:hypothetical protein
MSERNNTCHSFSGLATHATGFQAASNVTAGTLIGRHFPIVGDTRRPHCLVIALVLLRPMLLALDALLSLLA